MSDFLVSVVVPVYNEEKNIPFLINQLKKILKTYRHEIIFVNDGSTDKSPQIIKKIAQKNKQIKLVSFNRNFGHQVSLTCGYSFSKGNCVISIDADLQDPPEIIPQMIKKWQEGAEVVYAKRVKRQKDSWFKKTSACFFYHFINFLSDVKIPKNVGDFRLIDRKVVSFLNSLPEHSRFLRGLVAWGDFKQATVLFERKERYSGQTHYTLSKMINFALTGITSFSSKPLRIASYLGFISALAGFVGIIYAILGKIFLPHYWVTGWTALFVGIMFLGGVQLLSIGIIGEYIGKIYVELQNRPQYLIKEKVNI